MERKHYFVDGLANENMKTQVKHALEKIEAAVIRRALVRAEFVQVKAAELLGISKSLLQYKLRKYKIAGH